VHIECAEKWHKNVLAIMEQHTPQNRPRTDKITSFYNAKPIRTWAVMREIHL
jgi:hypothetical protein